MVSAKEQSWLNSVSLERGCLALRAAIAAMLLVLGFSREAIAQYPAEPLPFLNDGSANTYVEEMPYIDLDSYLAQGGQLGPSDPWSFQLLPEGIVYKPYLAGTKESRLSATIVSVTDQGTTWDATLGGRIGVARVGNHDVILPEGWQLDVEGSAQVRLNLLENVDVQSVDFRAGLPLTYGIGPNRYKFSYYHLSSHIGDEYLFANPGTPKQNFARDVLVLGYARYLSPEFRAYAEMGWAFYSIESEPWEFQFGVDYSPSVATGLMGSPFFGVNGHLRQELDYSGTFSLQAGWAWRGDETGHLLRAGLQYYNGASSQFAFYRRFEEQIGFGLWYDY